MDDVRFSFDVGQHGWASFELAMGPKSIELDSLSYCTDVLGDLVRLALAIATGASRASTSFDSEPAERRLIVQRDWSDGRVGGVTVRILEFPDIYTPQPDEAGAELFSGYCQPDALARAISVAAEGVLARYGEEGYRDAWTGTDPFPRRALEALHTALAAPQETSEV